MFSLFLFYDKIIMVIFMKIKFLSLLLLPLTLTSCTSYESLNPHIVAGKYIDGIGYISPMNTIVSLKMYNKEQYNEVVNGFDNIVTSLSDQADRYYDYSNVINVKSLNDSCGSNEFVKVTDELFEMIELGINLTKISKGKFNLAMGSLIDLYKDKISEESVGSFNSLPDKELIEKAMASVPLYTEIDSVIELDYSKKSIKLNKYNDNNVVISLGAIAKGFVMQKAYDYIKEYNYPALIDAGSSTMGMVADNPIRKKGKWNVSFRTPSIGKDVTLFNTISSSGDTFISTSGDYQQNFYYYDENNNLKLMHHIINPFTGVSNNIIRNVSLVSNNASLAVLDALSTALFNVNDINEAYTLINDVEQTYSCDISFMIVTPYSNQFDLYDVYISSSFNDLIVDKFPSEVKNINIVENY